MFLFATECLNRAEDEKSSSALPGERYGRGQVRKGGGSVVLAGCSLAGMGRGGKHLGW
jgi:hypothetical protein